MTIPRYGKNRATATMLLATITLIIDLHSSAMILGKHQAVEACLRRAASRNEWASKNGQGRSSTLDNMASKCEHDTVTHLNQ